jgi:hypothetical protein
MPEFDSTSADRQEAFGQPAPAWLSATFVLAPLSAWAAVVAALAQVVGATALFVVAGSYLLLLGVIAISLATRRGIRGSRSTRLDGKRRPAGEGAAS